MLLQTIILTIHDKLQYERSIAATYHLIQGKSSIQTIQDVHLFKLRNYYGIYHSLTKATFDEKVCDIIDESLMMRDADGNHLLTEKGVKLIRDTKARQDYFFNGFAYKRMGNDFFERLLLLMQVWTNSHYRHFKFIPVVDNAACEMWVKEKYQLTKENPAYYLKLLYNELQRILKLLSEQQATVFVEQLSGYQYIGKTTEQIASNIGRSKEDVQLLTTSTLHFILEQLAEDKRNYPVLSSIGKGLDYRRTLTDSARLTARYLDEGNELAVIAARRHLKVNTIYDHLIEIALYDPLFDLSVYVSEEQINAIVQAVKEVNTYKLKAIKERIDVEIEYYQIRLVLTRINEYR